MTASVPQYQVCPYCRGFVFRDHGSVYVTCPICNTGFCYLCGFPWNCHNDNICKQNRSRVIETDSCKPTKYIELKVIWFELEQTIVVKPEDTIESVKKVISMYFKIDASDQKLIYECKDGNKELESSSTISEYSIKEGDEIHLESKSGKEPLEYNNITLFVQTDTGINFIIDIDENNTVSDLMRKLDGDNKIAIYRCHIIKNKSATLKSLGIKHCSAIFLVTPVHDEY